MTAMTPSILTGMRHLTTAAEVLELLKSHVALAASRKLPSEAVAKVGLAGLSGAFLYMKEGRSRFQEVNRELQCLEGAVRHLQDGPDGSEVRKLGETLAGRALNRLEAIIHEEAVKV